MKYNVWMTWTMGYTQEIEANSREEAEQKALDKFDSHVEDAEYCGDSVSVEEIEEDQFV